MGTTPATFNGVSKYAADLQQAINHAVTIASLPLNQLTDSVRELSGQAGELGALQNKFAGIQTAIQSLISATAGGSLSASVGNNSVATATLDSALAVSGGSYTLNVINAGAPTTTLSNTGLPTVSDPASNSISSSGTFTLSVNGSNFTITPSQHTLSSLVQAINSSGAGVNATIVNLGPPTAPDYKLSLQSTALGNVTIQLNDGTQNLLSNLSIGTPAQYQVNGQPSTPISSNSSTITLAPGLTVNLLGTGQTTVTVSQSSPAAAGALSSFVAAYNATVDELAVNHGNSGGWLTGQGIVFTLQQSLRGIAGFSGGSGTIGTLADLGLTFDDHGHLNFDQATFTTVSAAHPSDVAAYLGTGTGAGFLAAATNTLTGLGDSGNGLFHDALNNVQQQIDTDNRKITDTQASIIAVQNQMVAQMSAADTLIASLQSKVDYFTMFFQETRAANGG